MKHKRKSKRRSKKTCSVKGCDKKKKKSVSKSKVMNKTDLKIETSGSNAYLCKEHYKKYKKATKEERRARRLSWQ